MADIIRMGLKIKKWLTKSQFELRGARAPRQTPSHHLQALVDEHGQQRTQLTPESHHRINTFFASIDKVLSKLELRFSGNDQEILCALKNMYNSETPDKESFSHIAKFYNNDGEILEAEQKNEATWLFQKCQGKHCRRMIFLICFQSFLRWCISLQWYTCYIMFSRAIIQCVVLNENLPPQHHGTTCQQHCTY